MAAQLRIRSTSSFGPEKPKLAEWLSIRFEQVSRGMIIVSCQFPGSFVEARGSSNYTFERAANIHNAKDDTEHNMYGLLTKCEVKMSGYWPSSFLCVFMDRDGVEVHKLAKKERGQYPAILTEQAWSIKDFLYGLLGSFSRGTPRVVPSGKIAPSCPLG